MEWLVSQGGHLYVPMGHSPDIDIIVAFGERLLRIEVKTTTCQSRPDRWALMIATRGGNQSWNGLVKHFDPARCDYLFAHVGVGRRWLIPTDALGAASSISLGGPKYSEFEVDGGRPLVPAPALNPGKPREGAVSTMPLSLRGSAGAGEPGRPVKPEALPEWVRFPPPPSEADEHPARSLGKYRTKAASNRSVVIPKGCFEEALLDIGDRFAVHACREGQVLFTRIDAPPHDAQP